MAKQTILSYEVLDLTGLAATGEAVGDLDGLLVYVPFGAPGDRVRVELIEQTRTFARARLVEIITPAPERTVALCDYFGRCGGCDWQHLRYPTQLAHKRDLVYRQLVEAIKAVRTPKGVAPADPEVRPCLPSFSAYDYRNSAVFSVLADGRPAYPALNPKELVAVDECPILEPALEEELHKAALLGISMKREWAIRVPEPIAVGNFDYYVGPKSPFPMNTLAAGQLVAEVVAALEPSQTQNLLDLYCGVGLFTLPLAVMSADVIGVEPDAEAGRDARRNVASIRYRLYQKTPPRILTYEIGAGLARPEIKARQWQGVVVSAPRKGLPGTTINQLTKVGAPRIVYVADGMATLARDLQNLLRAGYHLDYAQPLDLMPQTRHVHTVLRLSLG